MDHGMTDRELAAAVVDIERRHRQEVARIYAGAGAAAMLGLPLVVGLLRLLAHLAHGEPMDLADIGTGVGTTMVVGAAFAALYWAALQLWARM